MPCTLVPCDMRCLPRCCISSGATLGAERGGSTLGNRTHMGGGHERTVCVGHAPTSTVRVKLVTQERMKLGLLRRVGFTAPVAPKPR